MEDPPDGSESSTWLLRRVDRRQVYGRLLARSCLRDSNSPSFVDWRSECRAKLSAPSNSPVPSTCFRLGWGADRCRSQLYAEASCSPRTARGARAASSSTTSSVRRLPPPSHRGGRSRKPVRWVDHLEGEVMELGPASTGTRCPAVAGRPVGGYLADEDGRDSPIPEALTESRGLRGCQIVRRLAVDL